MVDAKDASAPSTDKHFADANEANKIMYIQQPKDMYSACFGGLMATRASKLGAAGIVLDGRFRDVREIQQLGLPVRIPSQATTTFQRTNQNLQMFAKGVSILGSNTFTKASQLNVPLQFRGDLWINPGDVLVADHDGVVVVPPSLVEQVAQLCQERKEIDERTMADLEAGQAMGPTIKKHRK